MAPTSIEEALALMTSAIQSLETVAEKKEWRLVDCERAIVELRQAKEALTPATNAARPSNKDGTFDVLPQPPKLTARWTKKVVSLNLQTRPAVAYRIVFHNSCTIPTPDGGLVAPRSLDARASDAIFTDAVQNHIDWSSRTFSPFVSLFYDKKHAENWTNKLLGKRRRTEYDLLTIDIAKLSNKKVYNLGILLSTPDIRTQLQPEQYEKELLVLGEILGEAVVAREKYQMASNGMDRGSHSFGDEVADFVAVDDLFTEFASMGISTESVGRLPG